MQKSFFRVLGIIFNCENESKTFNELSSFKGAKKKTQK